MITKSTKSSLKQFKYISSSSFNKKKDKEGTVTEYLLHSSENAEEYL